MANFFRIKNGIQLPTVPTNDDTNTEILSRNSTTGEVEYVNKSILTGTTGSGTSDYLTKWVSATELSDSIIQDDGSTIGLGCAPYSRYKVLVDNDIQSSISQQSTALYIANEQDTLGNPVGLFATAKVNYSGGTGFGAQFKIETTDISQTGVALEITTQGSGTMYGIRIDDGTQAAGKVLGCIDTDGRAQWVDAGSSSTFTGGTVAGATNFTDGLTANTISATTYYNLPKVGDKVIPRAISNISVGTASYDYYLNYKCVNDITITSVNFGFYTLGADPVRIAIYRGRDLTATLVGQTNYDAPATDYHETRTVVAQSGQTLTFAAGDWMVIGFAVGGTTTSLLGHAVLGNDNIAWYNSTDSADATGFPTNPRSKGGTRVSFPCIELNA